MTEPIASEPIKEKEPKGPIKVLIVEDDEGHMRLIKRIVDIVGGFEASCTDSTAEALILLREAKQKEKPIELIFSDLGLKDDPQGGFKIAQTAKNEGLAKHLMLFTGSSVQVADNYTPEQLKEKGIDELIGKPASAGVLKNCFNKAKEVIKSSQTSQ